MVDLFVFLNSILAGKLMIFIFPTCSAAVMCQVKKIECVLEEQIEGKRNKTKMYSEDKTVFPQNAELCLRG